MVTVLVVEDYCDDAGDIDYYHILVIMKTFYMLIHILKVLKEY